MDFHWEEQRIQLNFVELFEKRKSKKVSRLVTKSNVEEDKKFQKKKKKKKVPWA